MLIFSKKYGTVALQVLFLGAGVVLGIFFIRANMEEVRRIWPVLKNTHTGWVAAGLLLTLVYVWLQGLLYAFSFRAVNGRLSIPKGMGLFLRRNLASVFLPGGGLSSLAFFTKSLENRGYEKAVIHSASFIYAFMGVFSVAVVALPVLIFGAFKQTTSGLDWLVFVVSLLMVGLLLFAARSFITKGFLFRFLMKYLSTLKERRAMLRSAQLKWSAVGGAFLSSFGIEIVGVAHLYIAMLAVGVEPSLEAALIGYIAQALFLLVSPFFRGFGLIEVSLSYILTRFGYGAGEGIAIMLLFRIFEFWLVLAMGVPAAGTYRRR